jgi:hypothetical protein
VRTGVVSPGPPSTTTSRPLPILFTTAPPTAKKLPTQNEQHKDNRLKIQDLPKMDEDARLEVYIRMNDDNEKDYCFSVGLNDTFEDLIKIFTTLKLSLRPNAFYDQIPVGFKISTDPGYLTMYGGLLFNDDAHKSTKLMKLNDKVSDHVWPGQLIIPVWRSNDFTFYSVVLWLLTWLYTDLPDFISPTPGICLTNQISKIIAKVLTAFELNDLASDILAETIVSKTSITAQCIFFTFHFLKCVMVFFVLYFGIFNPYSLNPVKVYHLNLTDKLDEKKKQELISIGWTGSRRAILDEFKEHIREFEIQRVGGIVKASKLGLFEKLKNPGVKLGEGEGFQTPFEDIKSLQYLEEHPEKFLLSYDYFAELGEYFENHLTTESTDANKDIKDFRKFGPMSNTERIKTIIEKRMRL